MRICYFGGYRSSYPRNSAQILALRRAGHSVVECQVSPGIATFQKIPILTRQFWARRQNLEAIFVAEFNQAIVPWAWLLSRLSGAALVFDPAISFYEDWVLVQKTVPALSWRGLYFRLIDEAAFRLADCVLWYMPDDLPYFAKIFPALNGKQSWSPPAADDRIFRPLPPKPPGGKFVVHFNSSYLLTHGVDVILRAAQQVADDSTIVFELVGAGPTYKESVGLAQSLNLTNVVFRDPVPINDLPMLYAGADVCLGAFRDDAKLARLVELKIVSALASRRPVIAADSLLKRRFFHPDEDIVLVPPGDPTALATAIRKVRADPVWREHLAESGLRTAQANFSIEQVGLRLTAILSEVVSQGRLVGRQNPHPPL
jgi:glycosyltransferase involved in cell wall biosynthesis